MTSYLQKRKPSGTTLSIKLEGTLVITHKSKVYLEQKNSCESDESY